MVFNTLKYLGYESYFNQKVFDTSFDSVMLAGEVAAGRVTVDQIKNEAKERAQEIAEDIQDDVKEEMKEYTDEKTKNLST